MHVYVYVHIHAYTHTHTVVKHLLARHCLGTMDIAGNKMCKIPVPEEHAWDSGVDK